MFTADYCFYCDAYEPFKTEILTERTRIVPFVAEQSATAGQSKQDHGASLPLIHHINTVKRGSHRAANTANGIHCIDRGGGKWMVKEKWQTSSTLH